MTKEQLKQVLEFLNTFYPTHGDGWWSPEYVLACSQGQESESSNYKTVIHAIKCSCPEFVLTGEVFI